MSGSHASGAAERTGPAGEGSARNTVARVPQTGVIGNGRDPPAYGRDLPALEPIPRRNPDRKTCVRETFDIRR
jgi:hypothetical protein